jgi:hypothetical protein
VGWGGGARKRGRVGGGQVGGNRGGEAVPSVQAPRERKTSHNKLAAVNCCASNLARLFIGCLPDTMGRQPMRNDPTGRFLKFDRDSHSIRFRSSRFNAMRPLLAASPDAMKQCEGKNERKSH